MSNYSKDDIFLLFNNLPIDSCDSPPMQIAPGVLLESCPTEIFHKSILENNDVSFSFDCCVPGYYSQIFYDAFCLRTPVGLNNNKKVNPLSLLFITVVCLRLVKPLYIKIAGSFKYHNHDDPINEPVIYWNETPWPNKDTYCRDDEQLYYHEDLEICYNLVKRVLEIDALKFERFIGAFVLFAQVSRGATSSYQMAYLALFAILETLFNPGSSKIASILSKRIDAFLNTIKKDFSIAELINDQYISERNIIHGKQSLSSINQKLSKEKYEIFGKMYEICRLSLLGFISMSDKQLEIYATDSNSRNNNRYNNMKPADGEFMLNQKFWI